MPSGVKRAASSLKLVSGKHVPIDAPVLDQGTPQCPSTDPAVVTVWHEVVRHLERMRVLTAADRDVLHAYCEAVVQFRTVTDTLSREGIAIKVTPNAPSIPHPLLKIQDALSKKLQTLANEFGLTPAARTKIKVGDSKPAAVAQGPGRLLSS